MPGINVQGYAVLFSKIPKDGLFLGSSGVFAQCPYGAEGVAADEVVGVEFDYGGGNHIKKFLYADIILLHYSRRPASF